MSSTYNNFRNTTVRGNFQNSDYADSSILASATFDRDITVTGTIHNTALTSSLNALLPISKGSVTNYLNFANGGTTYPTFEDAGNFGAITSNFSGGEAELSFINNGFYYSNSLANAFTWYILTSATTNTNLMYLTNAGVLAVSGAITSPTITTINTNIANATLSSSNLLNASYIGTGAITNTVFNYLTGVSSNIQTQLNSITSGTGTLSTNNTWTGTNTFNNTLSGTAFTSALVGLGNCNNTTDLLKPISTATQTALNLLAPLASPTFTGTVGIGGTLNLAGASVYNACIAINENIGSNVTVAPTTGTGNYAYYAMFNATTFNVNESSSTFPDGTQFQILNNNNGGSNVTVTFTTGHLAYYSGSSGSNQSSITVPQGMLLTIVSAGGSWYASLTGCSTPTFSGNVTLGTGLIAGATTLSNTVLGYLSGVTSNIQTQINALPTLAGSQTWSGTNTFTGNVVANSNTISPTVLGYLSGVSSAIQTQLNTLTTNLALCPLLTGNNTFSGTTTFTGNIMANSQTITPANLGYIHGVSSAIQTQLDNRAILSASNTFTNATNTFNEIEVTNINASGVVDVTQLLVNCVNMSTNTTYTSANLPNIIMCFNASPTLPDPTTVGAGFIVTIKNFYSTHGCTVACTASNALYINGTANNTFNVGNGGFIGLVTAYGVWNNIN